MRLAMPMPRKLLSVMLVLGLVCCAGTALAAVQVRPPAADKPADPDFRYNRAIFDCQPPDSFTITLGSVITLSDSTIGRPSEIDSYPCAPWNESGPELVYRLNVATDMRLQGLLESTQFDLDLFLLSDCDSDSCLAGRSADLDVDLDAGVYYLVVDTAGHPPTNEPDNFTLQLTATERGLPTAACAAGDARFFACTNDTVPLAGPRDLFGQPNLVSTYACGTAPKQAGEDWYALAQGPGGEITIEVSNVAFDLDVALWLFAGCGPEAECLGFADAGLVGIAESLTWANSDPDNNVTVYLAVDAVREPVPGEGDPDPVMSYDITIACQGRVPVSQTSFGGLKSLYR